MISISVCRTAADRTLFERNPRCCMGLMPPSTRLSPEASAKFLKPDSPLTARMAPLRDSSLAGTVKPVGRIAAIQNRSHNAYWNDRVGFFGFFAGEDRVETAQALFAEVDAVLGKPRVRYSPRSL